MKKVITLLFTALLSLGAFAQHDHGNHNSSKMEEMDAKPMFKDKAMGAAYSDYTDVKEALVASNYEETSKALTKLKSSLAEVENSEAAQSMASKMTKASDLKEQRKAFADLSSEMATLVKGGKLSMGEIYLEYCPMANAKEGAYWLSNSKTIRNPFMEEKMSGCGMVKETIN